MKPRKVAILWFLLMVALPWACRAQSHDFGGILELGFEQKLAKGLELGLEGEGRFNHCLTSFNRLKIGADLDYSFLKKKRLKVSLGAAYLLYNRYGTIENRGRIIGSLTYTEKFSDFKLSLRARVQSTFYDMQRGYHKFNPKTYLRGRLQFDYTFSQLRMSIFASTEFFLSLYKKNDIFIENFRTIAGCNFKMGNGHTLGVFVRVDNEIQVADPENVYYVGLKYNFKKK
jgi:hypothetical protein